MTVRPYLLAAIAASLLIAAGLVFAQGTEGPAAAPEPDLPLWLPRPSRYFDRPMTEAEYRACLKRDDIPKMGPISPPPGDLPPAPRCLLEDPVSVEVNGTVLEALRALMGPQREWLAGVQGDSADKVAEFAVKDVPLWQALDKLLETYGYDWGVELGAVVCWPALIPARERPEVPEAMPEGEVPASAPATAGKQAPAPQPEGGEAADGGVQAPALQSGAAGGEQAQTARTLELAEPTPLDGVLEHFRPARYSWEQGVGLNHRIALDERLRDWKLVGRLEDAGTERGVYKVAAALPAVVQGDALEGCVAMGAHMWLDRAMRGAEARAAELRSRGIEISDDNMIHYRPSGLKGLPAGMDPDHYYHYPMTDRLHGLLGAQHWALMDIQGQAVIWFRELPLDVAELWVLTGRAGDVFWARLGKGLRKQPPPDMSLDWSRPEEFYVRAYYAEKVQKSLEDGGYRVVGRHVGIAPSVPTKGGQRRML